MPRMSLWSTYLCTTFGSVLGRAKVVVKTARFSNTSSSGFVRIFSDTAWRLALPPPAPAGASTTISIDCICTLGHGRAHSHERCAKNKHCMQAPAVRTVTSLFFRACVCSRCERTKVSTSAPVYEGSCHARARTFTNATLRALQSTRAVDRCSMMVCCRWYVPLRGVIYSQLCMARPTSQGRHSEHTTLYSMVSCVDNHVAEIEYQNYTHTHTQRKRRRKEATHAVPPIPFRRRL